MLVWQFGHLCYFRVTACGADKLGLAILLNGRTCDEFCHVEVVVLCRLWAGDAARADKPVLCDTVLRYVVRVNVVRLYHRDDFGVLVLAVQTALFAQSCLVRGGRTNKCPLCEAVLGDILYRITLAEAAVLVPDDCLRDEAAGLIPPAPFAEYSPLSAARPAALVFVFTAVLRTDGFFFMVFLDLFSACDT